MDSGGDDELDEKPIGELFGQLIDEGKAYARAELGLVKATAEAKADAAKKPALLGAAALLFGIAGVIVLCMTLALALATLIGPLAGGLIASLVTFAIAYGLFLWAKQEARKLQ
ncbi:MAG TPA: phage holin family protein [Sphingomicrobium sp.]